MKTIDLFSGCGGMSLGFEQAGFDIQFAVDHWQPAIDVYRLNFRHPIEKRDLNDVEAAVAKIATYTPDVVIGGPPCQDFSSAGKRNEQLGRADLTVSFAEIIMGVRPTYFVMENVARALKSNAYRRAYTLLKEGGYGLTEIVLNAAYCRVPQKRKRLFLIGVDQGQDNALLPYLKKNQTRDPMTMRDYFGDSLKIDHYYRHPRSYQRRGIFSMDEPSPTVRGVNRPIPSTYKRHPGDTAPPQAQVRPLTTHERSLVQTFPEDFVWEGSKTTLETMIGNAVPVNLAQFVASCLIEYKNDTLNQNLIGSTYGTQLDLFQTL